MRYLWLIILLFTASPLWASWLYLPGPSPVSFNVESSNGLIDDEDLVGLWWLEEDLTDESGNDNTLTSTGSFSYVTTPTPAQGTYSALLSGGYFCSSSADFEFGATWSIGGPYYPTTATTAYLQSRMGTSSGWFLKRLSTGVIQFSYMIDGVWYSAGVTTAALMPINTETEVYVSVDGTYIRLYVNGVAVNDGTFPISYTGTITQPSTMDHCVGSSTSGSSVFTGNIDKQFAFDRAITAAEASDIYANGFDDSEYTGTVYYVSDDSSGNAAGTGTGTGTISDPLKTLTEVQAVIDAADVGDTLTFAFDKSDTWSKNSAAISTTQTYGLLINSDDPIVHLAAYGSGANPIFNGGVTDFSAVPAHNATTGPLLWNRFFDFRRDNCSVKNITIEEIYGNGIVLKGADSFTLSNCTITNFGSASITMDGELGLQDSVVEYSTIHTGQQLYRFSKRTAWGGGIEFAVEYGLGVVQNNHIHHNTVYDIYGEGIINPGGITEYNIVGDCGSVAIDTPAFESDFTNAIVRNNFMIYSDQSASDYANHSGGARDCVRVYDEYVGRGGDNNSGSVQITGNVCINWNRGVWLNCANSGNSQCDADAVIGDVTVTDNLIIDPHYAGFVNNSDVNTITVAGVLTLEDNSVLLLDQTTSQFIVDTEVFPTSGWTVTDNHFYSTGTPPAIDTDWDTNINILTPELLGQVLIDWDGQTGATYYANINPADDINPPVGSPIYQLNAIMSVDIDTLGNTSE